MTTRFVPVLGNTCGLGKLTRFGFFRWDEPDCLPHVIELNFPHYEIQMRRPTTVGRTKGVWVHDSFFVPPNALCQTEHEAWKRIFRVECVWNQAEKSVLYVAQ